MKTITVTASVIFEDENLPWSYSEENFCDWVWEVFKAGYEDSSIPVPALDEAIEIIHSFGYTVEISEDK